MRRKFNVQPGSPEDGFLAERHNRKTWHYKNGDSNPILPVTPATAKDALRSIILDREKRRGLAHAGRSFLEAFCSPTLVAQDILDYMRDPDCFRSQAMLGRQYSFFNRDYTPGNAEEHAYTNLINQTTDIVRDCSWYKEYVVPCERAGMIF